MTLTLVFLKRYFFEYEDFFNTRQKLPASQILGVKKVVRINLGVFFITAATKNYKRSCLKFFLFPHPPII